MTLSDFVRSRRRFSRSANVERDHGIRAIEGYIPTGRALDLICRIGRGLQDPAAGRAFSITGPHGGGKSSLAVFLDGLLARKSSDEGRAAEQILSEIDQGACLTLLSGLQNVDADRNGFVRAAATAKTEPVSTTIARALYAGAVRDLGPAQNVVPRSFKAPRKPPSSNQIRDAVVGLCDQRPLLLVIDEFGKNLESYAMSGDDGDPFLLQELAELSQGENALPFVLITMQHLSFDEYVQQTSSQRRREWSKVQGRFQDIPFVETPEQSRRLIAASMERTSPKFNRAAAAWTQQHLDVIEALGLRDLADDASAALPLHPLVTAVLPDLCTRYGQNERTLFSFLAGREPLALPEFLATNPWDPSDQIPLLGVDRLYDYFLESSGNMIGVSETASRWLEIETRIRDTVGLTPAELRALKTIGVLNLVSGGGRIRASREILEFALADSQAGEADAVTLETLLLGMVDSGLIVYRVFSDEYRIWQGSDYNLQRVIDSARRECVDRDLADLLNEVAALEPVVAARHSQRTGVLRLFEQRFSGIAGDEQFTFDSEFDGLVLYATVEPSEVADLLSANGEPVLIVWPVDIEAVRSAAFDAAALRKALEHAEEEGADWVARRELIERAASSQHQLHQAVERAWSSTSDWDACWSTEDDLNTEQGLSAILSVAADTVYPYTPRVANEMIARRELTSQGAKARRFLIDAMIANPSSEKLGIEGYGPERAIYEAVLRSTGIHKVAPDGRWSIGAPRDPAWRHVWSAINGEFDAARSARANLSTVVTLLQRPPFGLKRGILPVLALATLIARKNEIALYEHGSLVLKIDDAVAERLAKNPVHFAVRNTDTTSGARRGAIEALVSELGISGGTTVPTFLNVTTALFRELRQLPPYTQRTTRSLALHTIDVRSAFHAASEPDVLLFETLPHIFGIPAFEHASRRNAKRANAYAAHLADSIRELKDAYPALLHGVEADLAESTLTSGSLSDVRQRLTGYAADLDGRVLEPRLKAFIGAIGRPLDDDAWLENLAMVVTGGHAPRVWNDDTAAIFRLNVADLGGALRRTLALLHDRRSAGIDRDGFDVARMTLTRPDGRESVELLGLNDREKRIVDSLIDPLLNSLTQALGSRSTACRTLMARLAMEDAAVGDNAGERTEREERHG